MSLNHVSGFCLEFPVSSLEGIKVEIKILIQKKKFFLKKPLDKKTRQETMKIMEGTTPFNLGLASFIE